jgi:predicted secreted protein
MSTDAILAQGTLFAVSANASPPSFSNIPEIRTIGGPDGTAPTIDVTDLDSTAREYVLGLKDEGAFSLGIMYIPANAVHAELRAAWANRTEKRFRVTFTDSGTTVWEFNGFVTGFSQNAAVDTVIEATVGIKITGSIYETT